MNLQNMSGLKVKITANNVGTNFGVIGVAQRGAEKLETAVFSRGARNQVLERAYHLAVAAGWLIEIGTVSEDTALVQRAACAVGVDIYSGQYVAVAATTPGARSYDFAGHFGAALIRLLETARL